jgi:hypothetical protein
MTFFDERKKHVSVLKLFGFSVLGQKRSSSIPDQYFQILYLALLNRLQSMSGIVNYASSERLINCMEALGSDIISGETCGVKGHGQKEKY